MWSGILKISDAANLAIHAMMHIAVCKSKMWHSVAEIATHQSVSRSHLARVMLRLTRAGLLTSRTGGGGGFSFGRPADRITLLDIYEAIDGPLGKSHCLPGNRCPLGDCALGDFLHRIQEEVRDLLSSSHLSELVHRIPNVTDHLQAESEISCDGPFGDAGGRSFSRWIDFNARRTFVAPPQTIELRRSSGLKKLTCSAGFKALTEDKAYFDT